MIYIPFHFIPPLPIVICLVCLHACHHQSPVPYPFPFHFSHRKSDGMYPLNPLVIQQLRTARDTRQPEGHLIVIPPSHA